MNIGKIVRQVAIVADREIVLATPVDTGRARANWIVTIGSPTSSVREPFVEGASEVANTQAAIASGAEAIGRYRLGSSIFIQNNLPYIGRLNDGYSRQAPANFVQQAIVRAAEIVKRIREVTE